MTLVEGNSSSSSFSATEKEDLVSKREEKGERIRDDTLVELNAIHLQIMEFGD